jgi:hypothetical protein
LAALSGLGNTQSYSYSIPVEIGTAGPHTLQGISANTDGNHVGASDPVNITIYLIPYTCDEKDPPAHANEFLNSIYVPQEYARYRGQVLSIIAFYHSNGYYGTCRYDYGRVESDVIALFGELGFLIQQ